MSSAPPPHPAFRLPSSSRRLQEGWTKEQLDELARLMEQLQDGHGRVPHKRLSELLGRTVAQVRSKVYRIRKGQYGCRAALRATLPLPRDDARLDRDVRNLLNPAWKRNDDGSVPSASTLDQLRALTRFDRLIVIRRYAQTKGKHGVAVILCGRIAGSSEVYDHSYLVDPRGACLFRLDRDERDALAARTRECD